MKKSFKLMLVVLCAALLGASSFQASSVQAAPARAGTDGVARFRIDANRPLGFDAEANDQSRKVNGQFWKMGFAPINLEKQSDGSWIGNLGRYSVVAQPPVVTDNGRKATVRIQSVPGGIFDYSLEVKTKNLRSTVEISGMGPTGALLLATLGKGGRELSVNGTNWLVGAAERTGKPGSFTGSALPKAGGFGVNVTMGASGSLYPATLVSSDTTLFLLLYVLPLHELYWPVLR